MKAADGATSPTAGRRRRQVAAAVACISVAVGPLSGCAGSGLSARSPSGLRVGVMLPLTGVDAEPAREELNGIELAADAVNQRGGIGGRAIDLVVRDVNSIAAASRVAAQFRQAGVPLVMGTYASWLSLPAAHAVATDGMVYWETGAVADQLTGAGQPLVFRVGASGSDLGQNSATFAALQLAPRLHLSLPRLRLAVVEEDDPYGDSVATGVVGEATRRGMPVVARIRYNAAHPAWDTVFAQLRAAAPDVVMLSSYIQDGVAFRRQMLARGFHTGALIGTTMAECGPTFGSELGPDAIGVFASDRPTRGFNPAALNGSGRAAYAVLADDYTRRFGLQPAEEAISGFSSAWALFVDVLPAARQLDSLGIAAAARGQDLAAGTLPNGAGLKFATGTEQGQNLLAASVIWQWQGVRHSVTVWPQVYAFGHIELVPLPR
ncbi:MAG TPA: ABC transporter substrate-binding protein [Mycobacteriales bacterium]|nr:ABC transporter substrate-binding protein [Mycobacteriales bacterium]